MNLDRAENSERSTPEGNPVAALAGAIDVHHHVLPPEYLAALAALGIKNSIGVSFPRWSMEEDLAVMDKLGVRIAVASFSTPAANVPGIENARSLARLCNRIAAEMVATRPERYGAFATMPPLSDVDGVLRELQHADALQLHGVELMSNYGLKYLGDQAFEEVYAALNLRKAVVHVHPNDPPGVQPGIPAAVMDAPFDTTRAACNLICSGVMERYPDITFILSHGGGTLPYLSFRLARMAPHVWPSYRENAPKGFDEYLARFYYDTAIVSPFALPYLVSRAGASKVLVGTDSPFSGKLVSSQCLSSVRSAAEIGVQEREAIWEGNARSLFPGLKMACSGIR